MPTVGTRIVTAKDPPTWNITIALKRPEQSQHDYVKRRTRNDRLREPICPIFTNSKLAAFHLCDCSPKILHHEANTQRHGAVDYHCKYNMPEVNLMFKCTRTAFTQHSQNYGIQQTRLRYQHPKITTSLPTITHRPSIFEMKTAFVSDSEGNLGLSTSSQVFAAAELSTDDAELRSWKRRELASTENKISWKVTTFPTDRHLREAVHRAATKSPGTPG